MLEEPQDGRGAVVLPPMPDWLREIREKSDTRFVDLSATAEGRRLMRAHPCMPCDEDEIS